MELTPEVLKRLSEPWPEKELKWVVIATKKDGNTTKAQLWAPHLDARQIQDRLDLVVGPSNWESELIPTESSRAIICRLTICGVTKTDVGELAPDAQASEPMKAAASDALKRAGVQWGIARYLYARAPVWVDGKGTPGVAAARTAPETERPPAPSATPPQPAAPPATPKPKSNSEKLIDFQKQHGLTTEEMVTLLELNPYMQQTPRDTINVEIKTVAEQKGIGNDAAAGVVLERLQAAIVAHPKGAK